LRQVIICLRPRTRYPPHPLPNILYTCVHYSILIHTGKGERGGELNQIEGERGNSSKSLVENTNMTDCISGSPVHKL
jgi:hypothetical protein